MGSEGAVPEVSVAMKRTGGWCLLAVIALAHGASADDARASAKKHVEAATALHKHRHWAEALDELNTAYTLDPQPELLYAIAQLHVALGDCPQAITFYERFIASKPAAPREKIARQAIEVCKTNPPPPEPGPDDARIAPPPAPPPTPVAPPAGPPAPITATTIAPPWYSDTLGDVLVGAGLVAGVTGALFYRSAQSDLDAANAATTYPDQGRLFDQAKSSRTYAVVAAAGGAGLLTAGILHYVIHDRRREVRPIASVRIAPAPGGGGVVSWAGGF
jgi:hypothetical protein